MFKTIWKNKKKEQKMFVSEYQQQLVLAVKLSLANLVTTSTHSNMFLCAESGHIMTMNLQNPLMGLEITETLKFAPFR